ncbi:MAG: hypothetical protein ACLQVD_10320 [Capsulimonadaceae bacterium]
MRQPDDIDNLLRRTRPEPAPLPPDRADALLRRAIEQSGVEKTGRPGFRASLGAWGLRLAPAAAAAGLIALALFPHPRPQAAPRSLPTAAMRAAAMHDNPATGGSGSPSVAPPFIVPAPAAGPRQTAMSMEASIPRAAAPPEPVQQSEESRPARRSNPASTPHRPAMLVASAGRRTDRRTEEPSSIIITVDPPDATAGTHPAARTASYAYASAVDRLPDGSPVTRTCAIVDRGDTVRTTATTESPSPQSSSVLTLVTTTPDTRGPGQSVPGRGRETR